MRLTLAVGALALMCAAAPMAAADGGGGGMSSMPSSPSGGGGGGENAAAAAYRDGIAALQAHNYHEAVRLLRVAQRGARNNGQVNYVLGLASYLDNDKDGARTALERAVHTSDAPADARAVLGIVYLQLGDQPHALEQQTALQTALNACDAACGDARHAELQRALDKLTQAITPPTPAATTPAPDSTTPPATNSPSSWTLPNYGDGRAAYAEAVGYINEEHWGDAFVALEHAQAAVGPHPDVLNYMGFVSRKMGHFDDAFAYYGQALAIDPNHLGANEYLGELYVQLGMFDRARAQLARLDRLCTYGCVQREELAHWINASAQQ